MSNYYCNYLLFKGEKKDVEEVFSFMEGKESVFDFNKIVPMPESLWLVDGSCTEEFIQAYIHSLPALQKEEVIKLLRETKTDAGTSLYDEYMTRHVVLDDKMMRSLKIQAASEPKFERVKDRTPVGIGKAYVDNIRQYGAATWYEWRLKNWGVRWNASDIHRSKKENRVRFETANGGVDDLIYKLAQKFPTVTIEYTIQYGDYHDKYVVFEYKGQAIRIKEES